MTMISWKSISFLSLLIASVVTTSFSSASTSIPFITIDKGQFSGIDNAVTEVYRTATEFENFWTRHRSTSPDNNGSNNTPNVDFSKEMVIAVCMGVKNTGGYDIEITSVDRGDNVNDANTVAVNFMTSSPSGMVTDVLTQPYHIIRLDVPTTTATSDNNLEIVFVGSVDPVSQPPPPTTMKFIITVADDADKDAIRSEIDKLAAVTHVEVMSSLPFLFVDFDLNKIGRTEAKELLGKVKGVNTVEADS